MDAVVPEPARQPEADLVLLAAGQRAFRAMNKPQSQKRDFLHSLFSTLQVLFIAGRDPAYISWVLGAITLIGLVIRVWKIGQPIAYDEAYTFVYYATREFKHILADYSAPNNHIFHTLLVRIAYELFGRQPWIVRLPALLAGTLSIPAAYLAARRISNSYQSLAAAALVTMTPWFISYSVNGRGYTLIILFSLLLANFGALLLIVMPTSLVFNWQREVQRFAPELRVLTLHGKDRAELFAAIPRYDICITTYPLLWRDEAELIRHEYHYVILDDAQTVKNAMSRAAAVMRKLTTRHRLCITGTPLENHLGELWSQFDFLMPGFLGDSKQFTTTWRKPIEKMGNLQRREILAKRVAPFILRRRKEDVAKELPPKTITVRDVELSGAQRDLYEAVRSAMDERVRATKSRALAARTVAEVTPQRALTKVMFTLGGADANENAIKLARGYTGRHKILTRYRSYHGATAGAMAATGDPRRVAWEPNLMTGVVHFLDPYRYRSTFHRTNPDIPEAEFTRDYLNHLEEIIR